MALNFPEPGQPFNELNLSDYYPRRQGFNSIVYIRKKLPKPAQNVSNNVSAAKTVDTNRSQRRGKDQHDKSPSVTQPPCRAGSPHVEREKPKSKSSEINTESVLEQTVKFVKNIVPLVLPNAGSPPLYYTIKSSRVTSKKEKKNHRHVRKCNKETQHAIINHKSLVETFRKENCEESSSVRESLSHSSRSNTVERINLNQSLAFSLSEISEKKQYRRCSPRESPKPNQQQNMQKLVASESLEALAADVSRSAGCAKIKIQLMNEKDKAMLSESIRQPVMQAILQCVEVVVDNCKEDKSEMVAVQKKVQCNSEKLDMILNKLASLTDSFKVNNKSPLTTPHLSDRPKASMLETLGQDLPEIKEDSSFEDMLPLNSFATNNVANEVRPFSPIKVLVTNQKQKAGGKLPNLGCGETRGSANEVLSSRGQSVTDPESGQKIPTRFCWTGAAAKPEVYNSK